MNTNGFADFMHFLINDFEARASVNAEEARFSFHVPWLLVGPVCDLSACVVIDKVLHGQAFGQCKVQPTLCCESQLLVQVGVSGRY